MLATFITNEVTHVLDDTDNRHANIIEHGKTLTAISKGYFLRGWGPMLDIDGSGKIYLSMLA
ncbi:hypothetical protein, partial [uncultured Fibrobacter sp.]|uniref:hypothetical protein n=1 Tax=uncultured Fibrobacter sp. TaxID=261512 RepID=UPI0026383647